MYQFIKPFLDNKMSIFEEYGVFKVITVPDLRESLDTAEYSDGQNRLP